MHIYFKLVLVPCSYLLRTAAQPFGFDGKTIESQKAGRLVSDLDNNNELHQVSHLFFHRTGATASQGSIQFETGLRSYGTSSDKLKTLEKTWKNTSKKDRKGILHLS